MQRTAQWGDWPAGELLCRKNLGVLAAGSKQSTVQQCALSQQENQSIAVNAVLTGAQLRETIVPFWSALVRPQFWRPLIQDKLQQTRVSSTEVFYHEMISNRSTGKVPQDSLFFLEKGWIWGKADSCSDSTYDVVEGYGPGSPQCCKMRAGEKIHLNCSNKSSLFLLWVLLRNPKQKRKQERPQEGEEDRTEMKGLCSLNNRVEQNRDSQTLELPGAERLLWTHGNKLTAAWTLAGWSEKKAPFSSREACKGHVCCLTFMRASYNRTKDIYIWGFNKFHLRRSISSTWLQTIEKPKWLLCYCWKSVALL